MKEERVLLRPALGSLLETRGLTAIHFHHCEGERVPRDVSSRQCRAPPEEYCEEKKGCCLISSLIHQTDGLQMKDREIKDR